MNVAPVTITNVRPWGGPAVDLHLADGVVAGVTPHVPGPAAGAPGTIDGRGLLALPGLVNAHAHVDKSWWGKPWQSYAGEATTDGRIAHERARRDELGIPSVATTVAVLTEFIRHGTTAVRTHIDVDLGLGLSAIEIAREAFAQVAPTMRYEIVAFPQDGVLRRPGVDKLLERAAASGVEHIGGIDPAGIDRDPVGQIDLLFDIAARHGCGLDIHLHDPGELGAFQLDLIIDRTRRTGLVGKVNLAHGFAIGEVSGARQERLLDAMAELQMTFTSVASVTAPVLPAAAMARRGIPIGLGTDGIRDLWAPYGDGDTLVIARNHARLTRARYDEELTSVVRLATVDSGRFVGRPVAAEASGFEVGAPADLMLVDAENPMDALVRCPAREVVIIGGAVAWPVG